MTASSVPVGFGSDYVNRRTSIRVSSATSRFTLTGASPCLVTTARATLDETIAIPGLLFSLTPLPQHTRFDARRVGHRISFRNDSTGPVSIATVDKRRGPASDDFSITDNRCDGATLTATGGLCSVTVEWVRGTDGAIVVLEALDADQTQLGTATLSH